jgi:hypothetical protein
MLNGVTKVAFSTVFDYNSNPDSHPKSRKNLISFRVLISNLTYLYMLFSLFEAAVVRDTEVRSS